MIKRQNFITGAIILGAAGVIARFLGLFFRWPVTMLIGDEGIGLYQLVYPLYTFIISIMSGFPLAISRMVSEKITLNKRAEAHKVFRCSLFILFIIGFFSSVLLYILSPYIIRILNWRDDSYYTLVAIAFAPVFISIMSAYRGYFQGLQMMTLPAASQIVEQLGRVIVGVGLTYMLLPYGISYSAAGASFGACAGAIFGSMLLVGGYIKNKNRMMIYEVRGREDSGFRIVRELLSAAFPISIGMTVSSVMSLIDSIVVPAQLMSAGFGEKIATELYGQLTGKANVLINVPLAFSMALSTSLVPAMAEVKTMRNVERIGIRSQTALKASIIFGLPSSVGLFVLSDPILHLVFPGISQGADVLRILSISVVFIVMAQILTGLLNGVGHEKIPVKNLAIGSMLKLCLSYILTGMPLLNIKGAAISTIVGYMAAAALNFKDAVKYAYLSFDIDKMILRPLLCTIIMGMAVYISYSKCILFTKSNGISTIISVIIGIIVYIGLLLIVKCVNIDEIRSYIHRK